MTEKAKKLRIIFMGTPEFAVASLDALVRDGCEVVGVITAPDKPAGRGLKINESAVKKYARETGIPVLQPDKLKNPEFLELLKNLKADLQIVVAFRMLPQQVWDMPPLGTINLHGSLLPQYRGAAPINWAIINGELETGVTTFKLQQEIDTGNILMAERIPIGDHETAGELHDRMKIIGANLLVKTIHAVSDNTLAEKPQTIPSTGLKLAPKIFSDTCRIDWGKSTSEVYNLIRGLSPFPGAYTYLEGKMLKIYRAEKEQAQPLAEAGAFLTDKKTYLKFACPNGYILVKEIQLEGKKKMGVEDFLRGHRFDL